MRIEIGPPQPRAGMDEQRRAVDRHLVHPLSNLMATGQVRGGDLLRVDYSQCLNALTFFKDGEDVPAYEMARMVHTSIAPPAGTLAAGAAAEPIRAGRTAKTSTKR